MSCEGSIREEDCPAHKQFEWDVVYQTLWAFERFVKSPVFKIEEQSCVLQTRLESDGLCLKRVHLNLLFIGPHDSKISYTDLCWFGLKSRDGSYRPGCWKTLRKIEVQSALEMTFSISWTDVSKWLLTSDGHLTFVFRKNVHRDSAVVKACIHEPSRIPPPPSGSIREEECSTHRQVEWEINYKQPTDDLFLASRGFQIGNHVYFLESCFCSNGDVIVKLVSLGPPVAASIRCWLGLKCANGSYIPKISSKVIDMREDMGLWTEVAYKRYTKQELEKSNLTVDRLLIFLRLNVASTRVETCTHDIPSVTALVSGSIREERCSAHTQVLWNVPRETLHEDLMYVRSPIFQIASQLYFFYLSIGASSKSIALFRQGCSMPRTVEWQVELRFIGENCPPSSNFSGTLNLLEEFGLWTKTDIFEAIKSDDLALLRLFSDSSMTVVFRINASLPDEEAYTNDVVDVAVQVDREKTDSHQDGNLFSTRGAEKVGHDVGTLLKSSEHSDVVIKVGNAEFKVHRAILAVRAPALGAMFQHDIKERATGEVTIDDCEPDVFEELLHYIYTGAPRELTAENASAVYAVADKYLLSEVTVLCVKRMKDTLGLNNFCDIVTLALMHKEEELLEMAIGFLSGRVLDVLRTVEWQVFIRDHSTWANEILIRVHELQARNGIEVPSNSD